VYDPSRLFNPADFAFDDNTKCLERLVGRALYDLACRHIKARVMQRAGDDTPVEIAFFQRAVGMGTFALGGVECSAHIVYGLKAVPGAGQDIAFERARADRAALMEAAIPKRIPTALMVKNADGHPHFQAEFVCFDGKIEYSSWVSAWLMACCIKPTWPMT
jgi:hypothetical protein